MKPSVTLAIFASLVALPRSSAGQACVPPSYPCTELTSCTPCSPEPPGVVLTGDEGEVRPFFPKSPGGERGAGLLRTLLPALSREFDFGSQLDQFEVPEDEVSEWADDWADGFDQSELPDATFDDAFERRIQPALPSPPDSGVEVPLDQGAPRQPSADGLPNNTREAEKNADPVNPANGELYIDRTDLAFPGFGVTFAQTRTYRSRIDYSGVLGPGWDFSYNRRLLGIPDSRRLLPSVSPAAAYESTGLLPLAKLGRLGDAAGDVSPTCGAQILYMTGRGTSLRFRQVGEDPGAVLYESADGVHLTLRGHKASGRITWSLTEPDGTTSRFDERGLLVQLFDANGVGLAITWETAGADWRVAAVTDSVGRAVTYEYSPNGRLIRLRHSASQLVATYQYSNGRLARAIDSTGRAESYEYDFDPSRGGGDWGPEGYLIPACELACAPASSSCDAGGACDAVVGEATNQCMAACGACGAACFLNVCGQCASTCSNGVPGTPGCRAACQADCGDDRYVPTIEAYCDQAWREHGQAFCGQCEDECEAADSSCSIVTLCVEASGGFENEFDADRFGGCLHANGLGALLEDLVGGIELTLAALFDFFDCVFSTICSWFGFCEEADCNANRVKSEFEELCDQNYRLCCRDGDECAAGSCNSGHGCYEDCRAVFLGVANGNDCESPDSLYDSMDEWAVANGCEPVLERSCAPRCIAECTGPCARDCEGVCDAACGEACHSGDCAGYCDSLDLMGACQDGCVSGCIAAAHEEGPYVGAKYGYPRDLNFNIIRIRDGNGQVYLEVGYGTDLARPDFDSVVSQTYGDFTAQVYYRDLAGEERGTVDPPPSGPARDYVQNSSLFVPVEICPTACSAPSNRPASEFVPWGDYLLEFATGQSAGGLAVGGRSLQSAPIAPNVLLLTRVPGGVYAESTAEGLGPAPMGQTPSAFQIILDEGPVTVTPVDNRSLSLTGRAEALDQLAELDTITVLANGSGRVRVYPGTPLSLLWVAEGSCREPFRASIVSSELRITPAGSCAGDITIAPLATAVNTNATKADVGRSGRRALDGQDLFASSPLVPTRRPVAWHAVPGGTGRYTAHQGTHAPHGDQHRAAVVNASLNLPLSALPRASNSFRGPLFVYHDLVNAMAAGRAGPGARSAYFDEVDVILDSPPASSDPYAATCAPGVPGPARHDRGARPERAAVMVDFYGVTHVFYFDAAGRVIRSWNQATGAYRSTNYDAVGQVSGVMGPYGERTCIRYDGLGNVIDLFDFPRPTAPGRAEPIRYRYSWVVSPVRLRRVYDPRGTNLTTPPTAVLFEYDWDANGNLIGMRNGAGEAVAFEPIGGSGPDRGALERLIEPDGAVTRYEYDQTTGGITRVVVGAGRVDAVETQAVYDAAGRPVWLQSAFGETTTLEWEGGRLRSMTRDAEGLVETTQLGYDPDGQLTSVNRGDRETTYTYDVIGGLRRTKVVALDGTATTANTCTRYGPSGRLLEVVWPEGNRDRYSYSGDGLVMRIDSGSLPSSGAWDDACPASFTGTQASGTVETIARDLAGRPVSVTDARELMHTIQYDGFGRPIAVTDDAGVSRRAGYDELGNEIWRTVNDSSDVYGPPRWTDRPLAAEEVLYDAAGRPIESRRWHWDIENRLVGDGYATTRFGYDASTRTVSVIDDTGYVTAYTSDPAGRSRRVLLPTGAQISTQHLDGGRRIERQWPFPTRSGLRRETTTLTAWGAPRAVSTEDPGTPTVLRAFEYDAHRRPIAAREAGGSPTTTSYDAFDRPVQQTVSVNGSTTEVATFTWNREGWLTGRTSTAGGPPAVVSYQHDALGRVRATLDPVGGIVSTSYVLASGAPGVIVDERGITKTITYDDQGNVYLVTARRPNGVQQQRLFIRDSFGRPTHTRRSLETPSWAPSGIDTYLDWDSLGNRVFEADSSSGPNGGVEHAYDGRGLLIESRYRQGGTVVRRSYDSLGRLTAVGLGAAGTPPVVSFVHPPLGPPTRRQDGPGARIDYEYDPLGRLIKAGVKQPNGALIARQTWQLPLDGVPRVAALKRGAEVETASVFTADSAGRLRSETHALSGLPSLSIAASTPTSVANDLVQPFVGTGALWKRYTLDGRHNFTSLQESSGTTSPAVNAADEYTAFGGASPTYDDAGALLFDGTATFSYDAFGDLASVDAGPSARRSYVRDAFGRIVLERDESSGAGSITRHAHDGARRSFRELSDGVQQIVIDGQSLDEHLLRVGNNGPSLQYYHQDRTGNVYLVTGTDGVTPLEWYRYGAYGEVTIESPTGAIRASSAIGNHLGFQGQPFDRAIGLVDMRNRTYRPSLGRFLTRDPIGYAGGTNLYAFVDSSPLLFVDPFGLDKQAWHRPTLPNYQQQFLRYHANVGRPYLQRQARFAAKTAPIAAVGAGLLIAGCTMAPGCMEGVAATAGFLGAASAKDESEFIPPLPGGGAIRGGISVADDAARVGGGLTDDLTNATANLAENLTSAAPKGAQVAARATLRELTDAELAAVRGGGRPLTGYHGTTGDDIVGIIKAGGFVPNDGKVFLGGSPASTFLHGADRSRGAAFSVEVEVAAGGRMVEHLVTPGVPSTTVIYSNDLVPAMVTRMFVRTPDGEGGFITDVIEGVEAINAYFGL